jgi:hypothetical protein
MHHLSSCSGPPIEACFGGLESYVPCSADHAFRARFTSLHAASPQPIWTIYGRGYAAESGS